ncbi:hypothetical protein [Mesorhizobium sp. B2-1-3]|uniref:hypothetical protein n=1 Tax=Mesorhizobium sp. B2-1-3 TaxID=2589972 RepID=UPI0015E3FFEC|nr:hypothetical protein [Mesorhizobium sp. B2-1-3]
MPVALTPSATRWLPGASKISVGALGVRARQRPGSPGQIARYGTFLFVVGQCLVAVLVGVVIVLLRQVAFLLDVDDGVDVVGHLVWKNPAALDCIPVRLLDCRGFSFVPLFGSLLLARFHLMSPI